MPYSHFKVDLDKLPDDIKPMVILIAEKHNALVAGASDIKQELDKITGQTPEEKAEMHTAFGKLKVLVHWVHAKKMDGTLALVAIYMLTSIGMSLGFNLTIVASFVQGLVHLILGL